MYCVLSSSAIRAVAAASSLVSWTTCVWPPVGLVISPSAVGVHAGVQRVPRRRIDRDGVDEGVAALQRGPELPERDVAGRIGAVGDHDQRGAFARAMIDERQRTRDRVVDRRAARGVQRVERRRTASGSLVHGVSSVGSWLNAMTK